MNDKRLKIIGNEEIARGTRVFQLERPKGFEYESGQTIDLSLIDPKEMDAEGPVRTFSLVSAPHEAGLMVATRMRDSAFKRALKGAEPGMELAWDGPYGSFIMHKNVVKPAVMLAGGIGITPFVSMMKTVMHARLSHEIYLFHSNRTPLDAPFLDELTAISLSTPNIQYVPTVTAIEKFSGEWSGERGRVDKDLIERHAGNLSLPIYYIAGPARFVTGMRKMLANANVDSDNVRYEEFSGY